MVPLVSAASSGSCTHCAKQLVGKVLRLFFAVGDVNFELGNWFGPHISEAVCIVGSNGLGNH